MLKLVMSVSAISSSKTRHVSSHRKSASTIRETKGPFKSGYVFINSKKIKLAATLEETARNINKKFAVTGVKAKIVKGRLLLVSSSRAMSIKDPNKLLADLVKNNRIGKGSSKDVQIVARHGNKNSVRVKYSQKIPGTSSPAQGLKLTEATSTELAKTRRVFPRIVNDNADILFALDVEEEVHHPAPRGGALEVEDSMIRLLDAEESDLDESSLFGDLDELARNLPVRDGAPRNMASLEESVLNFIDELDVSGEEMMELPATIEPMEDLEEIDGDLIKLKNVLDQELDIADNSDESILFEDLDELARNLPVGEGVPREMASLEESAINFMANELGESVEPVEVENLIERVLPKEEIGIRPILPEMVLAEPRPPAVKYSPLKASPAYPARLSRPSAPVRQIVSPYAPKLAAGARMAQPMESGRAVRRNSIPKAEVDKIIRLQKNQGEHFSKQIKRTVNKQFKGLDAKAVDGIAYAVSEFAKNINPDFFKEHQGELFHAITSSVSAANKDRLKFLERVTIFSKKVNFKLSEQEVVNATVKAIASVQSKYRICKSV